MLGGILQIAGLLALLCAGCRSLIRHLDRRAQNRAIIRHRLKGYAPPADRASPWPILEPEIERLRRKAAL